MHLDERGDIAAAQIATFGPLLFTGLIFVVRDPKRRMAWAFLSLMSVLRLIGAISHIVSEGDPTNVTSRVIYFIMEAAGQGPLLAATLGFLRTVSQHSLDKTFIFAKGMAVFALAGISGVVLAIVGGARSSSAHTADEYNLDMQLRHVGLILFVVLFSGCLGITAYCWLYWRLIWIYRRRILISITIAMPFLLVRMLYGVFSAFAPSTVTFQNGHQIPVVPSSSGLGKFSPSSPKWYIYFVMSVLMEWIVVIIYLVTRVFTALDNDRPVEAGNDKSDGDSETSKSDVFCLKVPA
ncbi:hypothetical protein GSI_07096 [Ganoderma sinense ZZ0214-1]|uniref:DUF7702 domain-containing protein n=1 Tax=Ganoderma sinense ZZ0214-1 TaxID=1077348 RepID=A0A2G8SAY7_9APHY|nr:hypothetical protein GSI_07096 [Ganoderma sinense ZZ0214-1]